MKSTKKILLLLLVFLTVKENAQVLFSNSFGSLTLSAYTSGTNSATYTTLPNDFSQISDGQPNNIGALNNLNSPFFVPALKNSGWTVVKNTTEKDTFLVSTSWLDNPGISSDDWFITPSVNVSANTVLTWLAKSPDAGYADGYEVYATEKAGTLSPQDFTIGDRIFSLADNNTSGAGEKNKWTRRSVALGMFSGKNLRFAFRNNSLNRYQLWIDDIEVKNVNTAKDAEASVLLADKYVLAGTQQTVGLAVKCVGNNSVSSLDLNYQLGNTQIVGQSYSVTEGLAFLQEREFAFTIPYSTATPGCYQLKAWIAGVNGSPDLNVSNDTIKKYVTVISNAPQKNVLIEQFVSANDPETPDAQQRVLSFQSDRIFPVNIHNLDSLEFTSSGLLNAEYKRTGSTAMIDRKKFSGQEYLQVNKYYYQNLAYERQNSITPVQVTVLNKNYDGNSKKITFTVKAEFSGEVKGNMSINAYVVENNVCGKANDSLVNGYNQLSNYYNVPWSLYYQKGYYSPVYGSWVLDAWRFKHHWVLLSAADGANGTSTVIPNNGGTQGMSFSQSYTIDLPSVKNGAFYGNPDNMYVIAYVAEWNNDVSNRTVLNCSREKLLNSGEIVGLDEHERSVFGVYPNPASDVIYFDNDMNLSENPVGYQMYDLNGVLVKTGVLGMYSPVIHVQDLADGLYFLEVKLNGERRTEKVIIKRN